MEFRSATTTLFLLMSLVSSNAWGKSLDEASWRESILNECSNVYSARLKNGRVALSPTVRENLARAVCSESRVFWSYVHVSRPETAEHREANFRRADENENGPMVIGVHAPTALETSTALHALRDLLYVNSDTLLEWTRDSRQVEKWTSRANGGAWGGLVYVNFEGAGRGQNMYKSERAQEALAYMTDHEMSASLLAVSVVGDARPDLGDLKIHWTDATASDDVVEGCALAL